VQDGFPTPTRNSPPGSAGCDLGRKEGTYTNQAPRGEGEQAVDPPGDAKSTSISLSASPKSWGGGMSFFPMGRSASALKSGAAYPAGGLATTPHDWETIEQHGGISGISGGKQNFGNSRLYADGQFHTADGKANLFAWTAKPSRATQCELSAGPQHGRTWSTGTPAQDRPRARFWKPCRRAWLDKPARRAKAELRPTSWWISFAPQPLRGWSCASRNRRAGTGVHAFIMWRRIPTWSRERIRPIRASRIITCASKC